MSYHDTPDKAYERFVNALASRYLDHGRVIPTLLDQSHNPAGEWFCTHIHVETSSASGWASLHSKMLWLLRCIPVVLLYWGGGAYVHLVDARLL